MAEAVEVEVSPSAPLDLHSIRSEVRELMEIHGSSGEYEPEAASSDSEKLLKDCALRLESKVREIMLECSDVSLLGIEDLDAYVEHLKEELKTVEAESGKISNEIENLTRSHLEDSNRLESDLEELDCSLDLIASQVGSSLATMQGEEKGKEDPLADCSGYEDDQFDMMKIHEDEKFEILELESQIEKNKIIFDSLQDLDFIFKRFDVVEQIEDSLTGLKVIEFDGNCFRLSMQTYIPKLEGLLFQQKFEDVNEPSEVNHELLIELMDGTSELKNVEIFPNDVYITDIVDAAKSSRQLLLQVTLLETKSSLQWFIGKVQDRIILSTLRRFTVKNANKSRHFFEYLDRDEMIVAHLVGVEAFIKLSQGWPMSNSPMKLVSLKNLDHHSKGVSLSFLCNVEELANSLDENTRENLSSFADAIEKIVVEQMRSDLRSDDAFEK